MFVEKLEEAIKEKAERSFEEDIKELEDSIINSELGKVLGYGEGEGIDTLWGVRKEKLKEDYIENFIEKEVESLLKDVEEEEEISFGFEFGDLGEEDGEYFEGLEGFIMQDFEFEEDNKSKFGKVVDVLRGRD